MIPVVIKHHKEPSMPRVINIYCCFRKEPWFEFGTDGFNFFFFFHEKHTPALSGTDCQAGKDLLTQFN